jgi:WD40 repeat protein
LPSGLKFALETSAVCPGHTAEVSSANFSPDGKQIVSASWDESLKLWDLAGNCLQTFVGHTAEVSSANFANPTVQTVLYIEIEIGTALMSIDTSLRLTPSRALL